MFVSDAPKPQGGEYKYSGMADHGPLPPPKEGGTFAQLITYAKEAQKNSDEFLTNIIEKEKELSRQKKDSSRQNDDSNRKKQKI